VKKRPSSTRGSPPTIGRRMATMDFGAIGAARDAEGFAV
jgi:hypothetical protein